MFKYVVSALLCFGTSVSCISHEVPQEIELPFGLVISPALAYTTSGHLHLMLRDFELALEDFRRASFCAEQCDARAAENVESMILFGQAIAYDNLNLREKCEGTLSALLLSLKNESIETEEESVEDDEESDADFEEFFKEIHKMVHNLVMLAPSKDVREVLTSVIEKDWNE